MKLYNTASRTIEDITPQKNNQLSVYTCGPTVYDYPHVGNWFTFIRYDLLVRTLRTAGFDVDWVMNITDVGHLVSDADEGEDKLEKGARREGKTAWDVAEFYGNYFVEGLKRLNITPPTHLPKASDHIAEQIALVKALEEKGHTYVISDGVYFDTSTIPDYGKLARLDVDEQQAGARVDFNPEKRNLSDFALWKFSPLKDDGGQQRDMEWWAPWQRPGATSDEKHATGEPRTSQASAMQGAGEQRTEPYQEYGEGAAEPATGAPTKQVSWGKAPQSAASSRSTAGSAGRQAATVRGSWGFPGWHLECSAMSMKYLGETIDIHSGGIDHIPVHHTNEIAQSEGATGKPYVRYWMHTNHIMVEGGKISKSLGNGITLEDIEQKGFTLDDFRLHVLESHYRSQSKFSWDSLAAARNRLNDLKALAALRWQTIPTLHDHSTFEFSDVALELQHIMEEDLHSEAALAYLSEVSKQTLIILVAAEELPAFAKMLDSIDALLGTKLSGVHDITRQQKQLIADREHARATQDWAASDKIRAALLAQGIGLRDTSYGAIWYPALRS